MVAGYGGQPMITQHWAQGADVTGATVRLIVGIVLASM